MGELREANVAFLEKRLGKTGPFLHRLAHGDDPRMVTPHREPRSRGAEVTLSSDVVNLSAIEQIIDEQAKSVSVSLVKRELKGRTVTLKVRYDDFTTITRSRTLKRPIDDGANISAAARGLLHCATEAGVRPIRLLGVSVSSFGTSDCPEQLWLDLPLP
jgi:DNA polymerase-4